VSGAAQDGSVLNTCLVKTADTSRPRKAWCTPTHLIAALPVTLALAALAESGCTVLCPALACSLVGCLAWAAGVAAPVAGLALSAAGGVAAGPTVLTTAGLTSTGFTPGAEAATAGVTGAAAVAGVAGVAAGACAQAPRDTQADSTVAGRMANSLFMAKPFSLVEPQAKDLVATFNALVSTVDDVLRAKL